MRSTRYLEGAAVSMHRVSRRDSSFSPILEPHSDLRKLHNVPGIGSFDHQGPRQQERWAEVGLALACRRSLTSTVTRFITEAPSAVNARVASGLPSRLLTIQHPDRMITNI